MHIDVGQIVTHMIGFLIAVWLLKRYAWGPILAFVEKRREEIASSFEEIEREKTEALQLKEQYDKQLENIDQIRREKIQEAAHEAEKLASGIRDEARSEAVEAREKAKREIALELDKANEVFKNRIIRAVVTTTEKIIGERLDADRHNKLIEDVLDQAEVSEQR